MHGGDYGAKTSSRGGSANSTAIENMMDRGAAADVDDKLGRLADGRKP
jgi:hypothetical protein